MPSDINQQSKPRLKDEIEAPHVVIALLALAIVAVLIWLTHTPVTMHGLLLGGELVLAGIAIVGTATYKSRAEAEDQVPATVIFNVTLFLVGGLVVVSLATFHSGPSWAASMIWSLACLALGSTAGFLFGIPRSRVPGTAAHAAAVATTVTTTSATGGLTAGANQDTSATPSTLSTTQGPAGETALEQISDWLTKIIVGVGLTNLTQMPYELNRWANYVAVSLDPSKLGSPNGFANASTKNFALGLIFYFCILGLISGYLLTQMFLLDFINKMGPTPKVLPPMNNDLGSGGQGTDGSTAAGGTGGTVGGTTSAPLNGIAKPAPSLGTVDAVGANSKPGDAAPPIPAEILPVAPLIMVPPPPDVTPLPAPVPIIVDAAATEPTTPAVAEVPPTEAIPDAIPVSPETPAEAATPPADPAPTDPAPSDPALGENSPAAG